MPQNLSAQFVCPKPKVLDFNEKRLHWASVVWQSVNTSNQNEEQIFCQSSFLIMAVSTFKMDRINVRSVTISFGLFLTLCKICLGIWGFSRPFGHGPIQVKNIICQSSFLIMAVSTFRMDSINVRSVATIFGLFLTLCKICLGIQGILTTIRTWPNTDKEHHLTKIFFFLV